MLALKIAGSNDIDINVHCGDCTSDDITQNAEKISVKYGTPIRVEPTIAQWEFTEEGTSVDIILYNDGFGA